MPLPATPRPSCVLEAHLDYLDDLRESGETNMFGARPYLQAAFPGLPDAEASAITTYWMRSFSERHPR